MNFMFKWQEQYFSHLLHSLMRYCSSHNSIKIHNLRVNMLLYVLFIVIDIQMMACLMIFRRILTTFQRFPKIFQNYSEG